MSSNPQSSLTPRPLWREALGRALRLRRTELGLTLSQVSRRSGVSTQFLSEVERGLKDPSSEVIEAVTITLGLEVPEVLGSRGHDETTARSATGRVQLSLAA